MARIDDAQPQQRRDEERTGPGSQDRDGFDFDQEFRSRQLSNDHKGARRWCIGVHMVIADRPDCRPRDRRIDGVDAVVIQLHHIPKVAADCLERGGKIREYLANLGREIVSADQISLEVERAAISLRIVPADRRTAI